MTKIQYGKSTTTGSFCTSIQKCDLSTYYNISDPQIHKARKIILRMLLYCNLYLKEHWLFQKSDSFISFSKLSTRGQLKLFFELDKYWLRHESQKSTQVSILGKRKCDWGLITDVFVGRWTYALHWWNWYYLLQTAYGTRNEET